MNPLSLNTEIKCIDCRSKGITFVVRVGFSFGFNGQEKTDEISGEGNHNTAQFWEYDTRLGRRWNLDPKPTIGISDYACFANNPIWFTDVNGDKVINKYKEDDKKAADRKKEAEDNLSKHTKGDEGYRDVERELKRATKAYDKIHSKFSSTENAIADIKDHHPDLFNVMDNLTNGDMSDPKTIDVVVEAHERKFYAGQSTDPLNGTMADLASGVERTAVGFTMPPYLNTDLSPDNNKYFRVGLSIKIQSEYSVKSTLFHEFMHIYYKYHPEKRNHSVTEEIQVKKDEKTAYPENH